MPKTLDPWLSALPTTGGYPRISEPRRFQHEEGDYDAFYGNDPVDLECGRGAVELAMHHGVDMDGPALEIGCGTGRLSLGLVAEGAFPALLLTDPSPVFLQITTEKLLAANIDVSSTRYALLAAEDISLLPREMFSFIVLRSALHHVLCVDRFLEDAARALRPGGAIVFQEPCQEGYVLMGSMAQFLAPLCAAAGVSLAAADRDRVAAFMETMKFYARRDVDKAEAEDKHAFRVDELMTWARQAGLELTFTPNMTFEHVAHTLHGHSRPHGFRVFFRDYLKYCMGFEEPLLQLFDAHLGPYCDWIDSLCDAGAPPYMHGLFVARRPGPPHVSPRIDPACPASEK
jgi:SAM-dependent methyltransferase